MDTKNNKAVEKKPALNVVDVVIILFLVACIVGIIFKVGHFGVFDNNKNLKNYRIYFTVSDIAHTSEEAFVVGDTVSLVDLNMTLGKLEEIDSVKPKTEFIKNAEGEILKYEYPENTRIDISGSIISEGIMEEGGYLLDGTTHITPGASYFVRTEHVDCTITIYKIALK